MSKVVKFDDVEENEFLAAQHPIHIYYESVRVGNEGENIAVIL